MVSRKNDFSCLGLMFSGVDAFSKVFVGSVFGPWVCICGAFSLEVKKVTK